MPGTIIRKYREIRNYTQDYVAKQMGISQNAYSKIENNYTQLTVFHIKTLSKILEISVLELLKDEFEIHQPSQLQVESVTKDNIIMTFKSLEEKIRDKNPQKHEFYPVIMAMLQAVDNTLINVH
jgi:transcriptional regulator with XRE-family HTH domain